MQTASYRLYFFLTTLTTLALATACFSPFGIYHTVHEGETLTAISRTYGVSTQELTDVNFLRNPDALYTGQQLFIPGAYKVKKVENASSSDHSKTAGRAPGKSSSEKHKNSGKSSTAAGVPKNRVHFIWPVDGVLTSGFGLRQGKQHNGIDIAGPEGTQIIAAANGKVIYSDNKQRNYGNLIIIQHEADFFTVYAHNKVNLVHKGDHVKKGQNIARIGNTGRTTGPHLHFEIRYGKKAVDPMEFLP